MIFPDKNVEEWKRKYHFKDYVVVCSQCGTENKPSKPFITAETVGLCIENCINCQKSIRLYSSIPRTEKARREWEEIFCQAYF